MGEERRVRPYDGMELVGFILVDQSLSKKEETMKAAIITLVLYTPLIWFTLIFAKGDDMLEIGEHAPDFSLKDANGNTVSLSDFHGKKPVVLFFYPGDETPGCTKQLCAVRDDYKAFTDKNAAVLGINPGDEKSHGKFIHRYNFEFPLLVDVGMKTAKAYGCGGIMVKRTVYVIDPEGIILYAKRGMPADEEILKAISEVDKTKRIPQEQSEVGGGR
jgi:thioredoxin-dependent peroxiredoxin